MIVAEYDWLTDPAGAVHVQTVDVDVLVVESDWVAMAGDPEATLVAVADGAVSTSAIPGVWVEAISAIAGRQEAYVSNNHSDPNALVLVAGGPFGLKPIWPDGPAFFTSNWKGAISIMSPTHASVRCSVGGC